MGPDMGGTESTPGAGPEGVPVGRRRWIVIGSLVFIAILVTILSLPGLITQPPGPAVPPAGFPPLVTTPGTPAPETTVPMSVVTTPAALATPYPSTPVPTLQVTSPPAATSTAPAGPPGFTVTITPAHATAAKGETVVYRMLIESQNGFSGRIHLEVTASFLFFSQTQDLGFQDPPYPKTIEYPFTVPDTLPPGITVNGVVRSTGDGIVHEDQLSLTVR